MNKHRAIASDAEVEKDRNEEQASRLTEIQQRALDAFVGEMTDKVIPEIVRAVEERRVLATRSREWPLKLA